MAVPAPFFLVTEWIPVKLRSRFFVRTAAKLVAVAARMLMVTVRVQEVVSLPRTSPYHPTDERFIYCLWHDGLFTAIFGGRCVKLAALVSQHADGSYVADAMDSVGIRPIRGSTRRGGAAALKQMMDAAGDWHITIATDGPRGPRRVVKEGIIFLASKTGLRILPIASAAQHAWKPKGRWTDLVIPKPFTRMIIAAGEPISVPAEVSRADMERYRQDLQIRMDELQGRIDAMAQGRLSAEQHRPAEPSMTRRAA